MRTQTKNEMKTPLFIFIKHCIQDANPKTISRVERYVNNYCQLRNAELNDKLNLKTIFNEKLKSL